MFEVFDMNEKTKCPYCTNGYGIDVCENCKAAIPVKTEDKKTKPKNPIKGENNNGS